MTTETMSRILLTILVVAFMSPAFYWISGGLPIFGSVVLIGGIAILWWIWGSSKHDDAKTEHSHNSHHSHKS